MSKVFISYRRDDAKWQAREIYRALIRVLPREQVFMDVDSISPGADFVDVLEGWVEQCDILLALIGAGWLYTTDPKTNRRRLEDPDDYVRIEVRKALTRGIPVVPVLLEGAPIPDAERLPGDLKDLTRRNAEFIEHRTVDADVKRLIRKLALAEHPGVPGIKPPTRKGSQALPERAIIDDRLKVAAKIIHGAPEGRFLPGAGKTEWFKDQEHGPEMVVVPAGAFIMGSPESELQRESHKRGTESPQHEVVIAEPFAVGRLAITRGQFAAFVKSTGHKMESGSYVWKGVKWELDGQASWRTPGFAQDDTHPVVCVNWHDAKAYAAWLSTVTGETYYLLSEAEREYVTRAGTTTPFWWGSAITPQQANYNANYVYAGGGHRGEKRNSTVPTASFETNSWGLHQVHGNVWEWCEDVWHDDYEGAPSEASARFNGDDRRRRVVRGGSWNDGPNVLRAAYRNWMIYDVRIVSLGFRLARTLGA